MRNLKRKLKLQQNINKHDSQLEFSHCISLKKSKEDYMSSRIVLKLK